MVERKRILAQVINDVIYENLLTANLSYLMLDINKLNDAVLLQLEESIESYQQSEKKKA
jgi:HEAT repeat protein